MPAVNNSAVVRQLVFRAIAVPSPEGVRGGGYGGIDTTKKTRHDSIYIYNFF
jgi:hypothetical protein